jgi:hypothetical protein
MGEYYSKAPAQQGLSLSAATAMSEWKFFINRILAEITG